METQKNQNGLAIASLVLGIVGLISSCIVIGVVPAIVGLVLGIVALAKKQNIGMSIAGIVCSVVAGMIFLFFMIIMLFGNETETVNTDTEIKETVVQDFEKTEENNKISEKESQENNKKDEAESKESNTNKKNEETEEEFKAACKEYAYKEIARNPKNFVGEKIVLTVKVYQILEGGLWGEEEYYRAYTNDEYGLWLGDEYIIYDDRLNDDTKVLQDDILKVYGTVAGVKEITRALTGVTEEIPAINMKYLELVAEDTYVEAEQNLDVEILEEYTYSDGLGWYTYHFMVIRNNSDVTVDVSTSSLAYKQDGTLVSADDASFDALGAGCTSVLYEAFDTESVISYYETDITVTKSKYYESVIQDLSYKQNNIENGAIFQVTNNGNEAARFVKGYVLFFAGEELVDFDSTYFTDDDSELKPGATISKQITSYKDFDRVEFYLTGRK